MSASHLHARLVGRGRNLVNSWPRELQLHGTDSSDKPPTAYGSPCHYRALHNSQHAPLARYQAPGTCGKRPSPSK